MESSQPPKPDPEVRPQGFRPFVRPPVRPGSSGPTAGLVRPGVPGQVQPVQPIRPFSPSARPTMRPFPVTGSVPRPGGMAQPDAHGQSPQSGGFQRPPTMTNTAASPNSFVRPPMRPLQGGVPSISPVRPQPGLQPNSAIQPPQNLHLPQMSPANSPISNDLKTRRVYPGMPNSTTPQSNPQMPQMGQNIPPGVQRPAMQPGQPFQPNPSGLNQIYQSPHQSAPGMVAQPNYSPSAPNPVQAQGFVPQGPPSTFEPNTSNAGQAQGFVPQGPLSTFQPGAPVAGTQQGYQPQMGQPGPFIPQQGYGQANITTGFQNMTMSGGVQPTASNLMAGPPPIDSFDTPVLGSNIISQAVAQHPQSNAATVYKQCTLNAIPQTASLLDKSKLPFGVILAPYRHLLDGDETVPVVQSPQIIRCRRCRTYINPWIQFIDSGSRWKCNVCFLIPSFMDWDAENRNRVDRLQRPELTHGVVEYIAPQEYMVRPPQPVVIVFLIDVSVGAVQSGMVAVAAKAIMDSLDRIPNSDDRTKVGFITFDSAIHFYNLASGNTEPQMMVVGDLEQPYVPLPYDLLVSLTESRTVIETFLQKIPSLFGNNQQTLSAFGKALRSAEKLIGSIGGKIVCLQHSLPNHDEGALKNREDAKLLGTAKETLLLTPATVFYKNFAVDCSPNQISLDIFLFNAQYSDVATLGGIAKFTGGGLYFYPGFNAGRPEDAIKFGSELSHLLTRPIGLEAVLRIRASKGIKMTTFHGNFFLRSTDLLSLPNVSPDNAYTIECSITEDIKSTTACFQTALLYTRERRIRVLTLCLPVTTSIGEVYSSADHHAIASLLAKKAVDRSLTSKIEDARDALNYKICEILSVYKSTFNQASHPQQLMIADNLKLLPIYILGMIKNTAFRDSTTIPSDARSYMLALHYVLSTELALINLYPNFWSIQSFLNDPQVGTAIEGRKVKYPTRLNLSSEKLDRGSVFILENGLEIFIWIGRAVTPELLTNIFGQPSIDLVVCGKTFLPVLDTDLNKRIRGLIAYIRETRLRQATIHPPTYIVREDGDPQLRMWFLSHLIEDRIDNQLSYPQFLGVIREKVQKQK